MTDDDSAALNISRRKTLAALGTIGVASAGAGLGTSAYFSDQETFQNNRLMAGSLDLKVDFEEHYVDWINNRNGDGSTEADMEVEMGVSEDQADVYLPPGEGADPLARPISLAFPENTIEEFKDATSIDAYPDTNDDGIQDLPEDFDICEEDADLPNILDSDLRTEQYRGEPLIALDDVKPGDFGEITLSFHLCDNPGFVWFFCDNFEEAENGFTEPELDDPDEDGPGGEPELADQIEVRAWYDDGDNIFEPEQELCIYHLFDGSGSMESDLATGVGETYDRDRSARSIALQVTEAADDLDGNSDDVLSAAPTSIGTITSQAAGNSNTDGDRFVDRLDNEEDEGDIDTAIGDWDDDGADDGPDFPSGGIGPQDIIDGLDDAEQDLVEDCENDGKYLVFYTNTDSVPDEAADRQAVLDRAQELKDQGVTIKVVGHDIPDGSDTEAYWEAFATSASEYFGVDEAATENGVQVQVDAVATQIANQFQVAAGEEQFFRGTLQDFCDQFEYDPEGGSLGFPLVGDIPAPEGGGGANARNCFSASNTHYVGFDWWLPIDHGNEVQTDSVEFDLGFYTEQCRHNNGTGMMNTDTVNGDNGDDDNGENAEA